MLGLIKNFDWEEFLTGAVGVHCDTEEKANDFLEEANKVKKENEPVFKWAERIGDSNEWNGKNYYNPYEKYTCYTVATTHQIVCSCSPYLESRGYKIIEWEIDEMKEFTEQDLKVGMLVKTSQYDNFGYGMIVPSEYREKGVIYERGGWDCVFFDNITEVWGYCSNTYQALRFDTNYRKLLYKQNRVKKMTVKEICDELGYKVEIIEG